MMWIAKSGQKMLVDPGTLPYWEGLGWQADEDANGVGDLTQQAATYEAFATPTPPASPVLGQEWLSNAYADLRVSHAYSDRQVLFSPLSGEGSVVQEPSAWDDGVNVNALYTIGGLAQRQCPLTSDPLVTANWTKVTGTGTAGAVIGKGAAGMAAGDVVNHASTYVEAGTVYVFGNDATDNTIRCWSAPLGTTTYTLVGTVIPAASLPSGATTWGNTRVVKDPGSGNYFAFQEYHDASSNWQMAQFTSATVSGTYTVVAGTTPMTSLYPNASNRNSASGMWITLENGLWVGYYHTQNVWNGLSQVYRATAPSLGANNFTVDNNSQPIIRPVGQYEIDQTCDIELWRHPKSGTVYGFWTGMDNNTGTARIYAQAMLPTRKRWNGVTWERQDGQTDVTRGVRAAQRPSLTLMGADFSGTSTTFADVTGLSQTWAAAGRDVEVEFTATVTATGASGLYKFQAVADATNASLGGVDLTIGVRTNVCFRVRVQEVDHSGHYIPVKIQYLVPAGGTLNIRPVGQAGIEFGAIKITDIAYRVEP